MDDDQWYIDLLSGMANNVERQVNERISLATDVELDAPEECINDNDNEGTFRKELEVLLNRYSIDNDLNTPDFILADYIMMCLHNYKQINNERDVWFGYR